MSKRRKKPRQKRQITIAPLNVSACGGKRDLNQFQAMLRGAGCHVNVVHMFDDGDWWVLTMDVVQVQS